MSTKALAAIMLLVLIAGCTVQIQSSAGQSAEPSQEPLLSTDQEVVKEMESSLIDESDVEIGSII